jgi:hypothetical protein
MAKLLKLRRGTTTQHASFTGAEGEVTIDTTKDTAVVHDGAQAGGRPLAREDLTNVSSNTIAGRLANDSLAVGKLAPGTLPSDVKIADANISGNLTIESADIVDGTIVNADIAANAAIAGSKLENSGVTAGQYGSSSAIPIVTVDAQGLVTAASTTAIDSTTIANGTSSVAVANNGDITATRAGTARLAVNNTGIDVTGRVTADDLTVQNTSGNLSAFFTATNGLGTLEVGGSTGAFIDLKTPASDDYDLRVDASGTLTSTGSIALNTASGQSVSVQRNLDVGAGLDVTGNITVTGTVDGVDVAALNTTVGNLGISNGAIASGTTAVTQGQSANNTQIATTSFVKTAISDLVDSSPGALNTLNELAAAINDDASFSTTVNNNIATKMPLSGGEFTGNVTCEDITPDGDSTRNLGTNSTRFANVYADNFVGSGANLTGIESFVSGMILLWSGSTGSIPSGFVLCNGSNSTPDLRDRFVVGAGNSYSVGATGGSNTGTDTVNISGSDTVSITVSGTATGYTGYTEQSTHFSNSWNSLNRVYYNYSRGVMSLPFSGTGTDTVNISGSDTVSIDNRPPYYALCYIMKT